jgi:hypothetical protein
MVFEHENFILDLDNAVKAKLYFKGSLAFVGDGYKAIKILLNSTNNPEPVELKFKSQLTLREKPKFSDTEKK